MFCPYCGSENSEDSKFCAACGRQITGDGGAAPDSPISGTGSSEHSGYAGPSPPPSHGFQSEPYGADLEGYQISVTRIYVMFILSFGVYYIYWDVPNLEAVSGSYGGHRISGLARAHNLRSGL